MHTTTTTTACNAFIPVKIDEPDTPPGLRGHEREYLWALAYDGRDVFLPVDVYFALPDWDSPQSTGAILIWSKAASRGFTVEHARKAVMQALASNGRRHRFRITLHSDGDSFLIEKIRGQRPPPLPLRREMRALNLKAKSLKDLESAFQLQEERAILAAKLHEPLCYSVTGRPRGDSIYGFDDWASGEWRVFASSEMSARLRATFATYCKVRGLEGRLEMLTLADGRLAVLRHGESSSVKIDDDTDVSTPMMQADRHALWLPRYEREALLASWPTYTHHERITVGKAATHD